MLKNKSYIGISFIILIFGIYALPKIMDRIQNNDIVKGDRLDKVSTTSTNTSNLVKIGPAPKFLKKVIRIPGLGKFMNSGSGKVA